MTRRRVGRQDKGEASRESDSGSLGEDGGLGLGIFSETRGRVERRGGFVISPSSSSHSSFCQSLESR